MRRELVGVNRDAYLPYLEQALDTLQRLMDDGGGDVVGHE